MEKKVVKVDLQFNGNKENPVVKVLQKIQYTRSNQYLASDTVCWPLQNVALYVKKKKSGKIKNEYFSQGIT